MSNLFTVNNISFQYDNEKKIFEDFSFEVSKGERIVIKGASGRGKTTLFRLLLGFEQVDKGTILLEGKDIVADYYATIRRLSAWLPQDLDIGSGTVKEVIAFPFSFKTNKQKPQQEKILEVFELLGLSKSLLQQPFPKLSTGQRQRVGLALCYLLNKEIYLLDEPTSALDENAKKRVAQLILENNNHTVITTSHDPFWLNYFGRIISLDEGSPSTSSG